MYADDTQLMKNTRIIDVSSAIQTLQQCIEAIRRWCSSRRLQLNSSKTEVIWFGTKANLKKMENSDISMHVGNDVIEPASPASSPGRLQALLFVLFVFVVLFVVCVHLILVLLLVVQPAADVARHKQAVQVVLLQSVGRLPKAAASE